MRERERERGMTDFRRCHSRLLCCAYVVAGSQVGRLRRSRHGEHVLLFLIVSVLLSLSLSLSRIDCRCRDTRGRSMDEAAISGAEVSETRSILTLRGRTPLQSRGGWCEIRQSRTAEHSKSSRRRQRKWKKFSARWKCESSRRTREFLDAFLW